jgi:hypothetical protein
LQMPVVCATFSLNDKELIQMLVLISRKI